MRVAAILLLLLAAGCATLRPGAEQAIALDEAVAAALEAKRAPAAEAEQRLAQALRELERTSNDRNRLQAALLLATLEPPLRDDTRAAALLDPLAARTPETPLVRFASLLRAQIAERRQAQGSAESAQASAERAQATAERAQAAAERAAREGERAVKESARREHALRVQIEALRKSERGMIEREERLGKRER